MYNDYLIPANTKKGRLIFGLFRPFDLALFAVGVLLSFLLISLLPLDGVWMTLIALSPALITGFLVLPVPNYHNMLVVIQEMYEYYTTRHTYRWKGWCYKDGKKGK